LGTGTRHQFSPVSFCFIGSCLLFLLP
jgi:hypothetical protein